MAVAPEAALESRAAAGPVGGWTLRYLGAAHWFGVVACPAGEHTFSVDSTARVAETIAKEVPKLLRACPHSSAGQGGSKVARRLTECDRLLARAEQLIDMADTELVRAEAKQAALAELDRIELLLDTAEASVGESLAEIQDEALERAAELDDAPAPRSGRRDARRGHGGGGRRDRGRRADPPGDCRRSADGTGPARDGTDRRVVDADHAAVERVRQTVGTCQQFTYPRWAAERRGTQ